MDFRVGDEVICVDDEGCKSLKKGVRSLISYVDDKYLYLDNVLSGKAGWLPQRFRLVGERQNQMKEMYLIIVNNENGTSYSHLTKEELKMRLKENYWGDDIAWIKQDVSHLSLFFPESHNTGIIIKGETVVPTMKPVKWECDI